MKKTVCTIIDNNRSVQFLNLLKKYNIHYVECVPTDLSNISFLKELEKRNIKISSIQGLLYNLDGRIAIEKTWSSCFLQIKKIYYSCPYAIKYFVFGSPKWRSHWCDENILLKFMKELSNLEKELNINICFENCASNYGSILLNKYKQVIQYCQNIDLSFMLDRSSFLLEKETTIEKEPKHFHFSFKFFQKCPNKFNKKFLFKNTEFCALECVNPKSIEKEIQKFSEIIT
jgi:sugar phosphate isomerase/epimerase